VDRGRALPKDSQPSPLWAITGVSGELSEFNGSEARLKNHMLATAAPHHLTHDGLDYVELPYGNTPCADIPKFWGGLSGAGLWLCFLVPGATQAELTVIPVLSGVAFYQNGTGPRRGTVRCHGSGSIDTQGLDHVV
jgi:hypothetical protein